MKRQATLAQRAEARRTRQQIAGAALGIVIVIGGIFGLAHWNSTQNKKKTPTASATGTASATPTAAAGACPTVTADKVAKPQQFKTAPPKSLAANRTWTATVKTTCGTMTFQLDGKKAPQTVASFIYLARKGFFTNTTCHRLTTTGLFVLQCGDPTGTGSGGPGYGFGIENAPTSGVYPAGTIAMARSDSPTSNGSQFFLVYQATTLQSTTGGYSIFGKISTGLDVVKEVAAGGTTNGDGPPNTPINITSVSVK